MTKKSTTKRKINKTSRLGHDPLADINVDSVEEPNNQPLNIEPAEPGEQTMETKPDSTIPTLHLPSRFSIAEVEGVYGQMTSVLAIEENSIEMETAEVESIDTAALQLLYAFTEQTRILGKNIHWLSRSNKIDDASRILNINIFNEND